jgi:branched-chain amino acid transport system permease protein
MNETNISSGTKLKRYLLPLVGLIFLALLVSVPFFNSLYITVLLITIMAFVILTVAWALFSGPTGYVSLASAAFFGIGMYSAAVFGKQMPLFAVILLAAFISFGFALLIGAVTLRLRGIYFTIFTFGLVFFIQQLLTWWEVKFTHTRGRFVVVVDNDTIYFYMLAILVICIVTAFLIRRSKWGRALRSIGQNEEASAHSGVNVTPIKILTFALSALFMAAAGATMATRVTYIDPGSAFNINYSFFPVMMAIFGGMTNLYGQMIGAGVFAFLEEFLTTRFPIFYMLIFGAVMVAVITFLPDGLIGLVQRWRKGGLRKKDARN